MRSSLLLLAFFSLLLCTECNARKEPADYWKSIMKDQAIPEVLMDLYKSGTTVGTGRFVKDFDIKPNVIIYHHHGQNHDRIEVKTGRVENKNSDLRKTR